MILNPGEIHIWSTTIDERYGKLLANSFLSINEKRSAARFTHDIDTYLFSIRHNLLRIILGAYLQCDPAKIKFNNNHYQKQHIAHPNTLIQFNISASSNRFLAVFCQQHAIGADIELIRDIEHIPRMINDYFTDDESEWINSQPEHLKTASFFQIFSRKEALVKAIGKGLNIEIKKVDVLSDETIIKGKSFWQLQTLNLFDDCKATIALNSATPKLIYQNLDRLF